MTEKEKKYKLAVIIGENCRNAVENMDNIECFLDLFGVDYDIYACVDKPEKLSAYKNIVSNIPFHTVSGSPEVIKMIKTCGEYMKNASWQWVKCNVATRSIVSSTQYTHMMKLRTDCVFRFPGILRRMFPTGINIGAEHVNEVKNMFKSFLNAVYVNKSITIMGDKIALGEYNATKNWFENFVNRECLQKMYANPPVGPDYIASGKSWLYNKVPTKIQPQIQHGARRWNPLTWFQLTWFTNADNSILSAAEKKNGNNNLSVGVRGSRVKVPNPIREYKYIMDTTKTIKTFLSLNTL